MASYISSPQFSLCALNWIYCPACLLSADSPSLLFSFFCLRASPSFMWLIGLIPAVRIEVCQSCENGRSQTWRTEVADKVSCRPSVSVGLDDIRSDGKFSGTPEACVYCPPCKSISAASPLQLGVHTTEVLFYVASLTHFLLWTPS